MFRPLGIVDLQGVAVLGSQQAGQDLSLAGDGGVLPEVSLDAPVGVEDVNEQLLLGMDSRAGELRADVRSLAAVNMALRTQLLVELFAPGRVSRLAGYREHAIDHLLAVGIGEGACAGEQLRGQCRHLLVGVAGKSLLLVQRQGREVDAALSGALQQVP